MVKRSCLLLTAVVLFNIHNISEHPRIAAQRQVKEELSTCKNPETGCYRDNPGALLKMLYFDDGVVRVNLHRIAISADQAALDGIPLKEATYMPMRLDTQDDAYGVVVGKIVRDGMSKPVPYDSSEVSPNTVDELEVNVATCAYVCGLASKVCPTKNQVPN